MRAMMAAERLGLDPLDTNGLAIILLTSFVLTASSTNLDIIDKQMISAASQLVKLMNPSTSTEQKEQLLVDEAERIKAEFANLNKKKDEYNKLGVGKDLNFDVQQYMCNCFISPPNIQKV
jgi:hypothetical protein